MQQYLPMIIRQYWIDLIEESWKEKPVIWLAGVRRVGKTFLCKSLPNVEYFDCELPRIRKMMDDPEAFLESNRDKRIILDEVHRLGNPSELLKIASDHFQDIRVVATGSSTLGASKKFKDTLAGRKRNIRLTPIMFCELSDFGNNDLSHRFIRGGLPPFFMSKGFPEKDFQEWMDAYWAKDIQELFRLERRSSFQKFAELIMAHSGGIFEATRFSTPCEVSRTTISNYLNVLETTFVATIVRPFSSHKPTEIVSAPKVYGFDTGFICYHKGWHSLRREDMGMLWEHLVLNEMQAILQGVPISYWRDKSNHEIDFILKGKRKDHTTIECKWSTNHFESRNLRTFRRQYTGGRNFVVANDVDRPFERTIDGLNIEFIGLSHLIDRILN